MARPRKQPERLAVVRVRLLCVYSGVGTSNGFGDIVEVDQAEADRLIALGAAERVA